MKKAEMNQFTFETIHSIRSLREKVLSSNAKMQKEYIYKDSHFSSVINEYISNYREFYLYYTLNLQEAVVTRPALIKEIDLDLWVTSKNCTNRDLMLKGKPPYAYDDENGAIDLHHIGQKYDAPFAELTAEEHLMYGNNHVFHTSENESWRSNKEKEKEFTKERSIYWKKRANGDYTTTPISNPKEIPNRQIQLPSELQEEIKETIETLFKECSFSDLIYLSDLAKSYSLVKQTGVSSISDFIFSIRNQTGNSITCSHCQSTEYVMFGTYATVGEKIQRYKCKQCGKIFTATNKSLISGSSFTFIEWIKFIDCLYNGYTISQTAKTCNISEKTAHDNRVKLFYALKLLDDKVKLKGNIVIDETFIPVSFKGNHSKEDNFLMPRTAHKRGKDKNEKGLSRNQVCIVCALDDNGNSIAHVCGTGASSAEKIGYVLDNYLDSENVFCIYSDESTAIKKYAQSSNFDIRQAKSDAYKQKSKNFDRDKFVTYKYLQTMNSYHSRLKRFMDSFSSVSTKLLSGYLYLFTWKERNKDREPIEAYKELLSVMTEPNLYISVDDITKNKILPDALDIDKLRKKARFANLDRDNEIYRRFAEGESMASIGRDLGMSRQNVSLIINRFRDYGLAYKTNTEINNENSKLNHESEKQKRKEERIAKRYNRELGIYMAYENFFGTNQEFYDYIKSVYGYTEERTRNILKNVRYKLKMSEDFSIHDEISYKSLEEIYREIFDEFTEMKTANPEISNQACYKKIAPKYNYKPENINRIVKIMSTEKETNYFSKKRKLSPKDKKERDKLIFNEFLEWKGENKDFYPIAAKKYGIKKSYVQEIISSILVSNESRYKKV